MNDTSIKYFLAANSAEGFISYFSDCYNPFDGWKAYIIKGGPGTGKSSFMRYIASEGEKSDLKTEYFPCSSDPNSLDAVSFPEIKTVIMDGTAPHIVDPKFVGICENLLDFGVFWDENKLLENGGNIIKLTTENKSIHKTASNYIKTAGNLIKSNYDIALSITDKKKAEVFADKLIKKHIPNTNKSGFEWIRFLSGITPLSIVSYADSVTEKYKNIVIIKDEFGAVFNFISEKIQKNALNSGHEIITIKNPLLPSLITDGIIIPNLSFALLRENKFLKINKSIRRVHSERFLNGDFSDKKNIIKFNFTSADSLLSNASSILLNAKKIHDKLEECYIGAMDFDSLSVYAKNFVKNIIKKQ